MKIIFLGTPEFASIVLQKLIDSKHKVVAVVCREDKPFGRGNKLVCPPAKVLALKNDIPCYQFHKIRIDGVETLKSIEADIMITAAYGQILSQEIIDICPNGIINVHGSLLPKYRGASPIQYAILKGETKTGVSILQTDAGMDTGDVILKKETNIEPNDTYGTLSIKLANLGSQALLEALDKIENKTATWTKQDDSQATATKMFKDGDDLLDFNDTKENLVNKVRALNPNPVATFMIGMDKFKVFELKPLEWPKNALNGQILEANGKKGLIIKCANGAVSVEQMIAPSSKLMSSKSYLNGKKLEIGKIVNE